MREGAWDQADARDDQRQRSKETIESVKFAVGFWNDCCDPGGLAWDDSSNNRAFLSGSICATNNGASIYLEAKKKPTTYLTEKGTPMWQDCLHAPLPKGPGGQFNLPGYLAVSGGQVYVGDINNNRIDRFDPTNFAASFTSFGSGQGSGPGQFFLPSGVAVDGSGNIFVADTGNDRIVQLATVPEPRLPQEVKEAAKLVGSNRSIRLLLESAT